VTHLAPPRPDMRETLERVATGHLRARGRIVGLLRRPFPYRSSFALEEIELTFEDGTTLDVVFKNLSPEGLLPEGRRAKPDFLYDPLREIETYRRILTGIPGTPICYGAVIDPPTARWWLFIERVKGVPLTDVGEGRAWREAARWLARMHGRFLGHADRPAHPVLLLRYDEVFYRCWLERSRSFVDRIRPDLSAEARSRFYRLGAGYDRLVTRLSSLPTTFLHGEFFPSNVLVQGAGPALRIRPLDWEMAGIGPGAIDLAALVSGGWSEEERSSIALAYLDELAGLGSSLDEEEFFLTLDMCRLHVAVQRLGWSPDWSPPAEHAHDWLGEALVLAEKLGL
jgi:hypothetical protein